MLTADMLLSDDSVPTPPPDSHIFLEHHSSQFHLTSVQDDEVQTRLLALENQSRVEIDHPLEHTNMQLWNLDRQVQTVVEEHCHPAKLVYKDVL